MKTGLISLVIMQFFAENIATDSETKPGIKLLKTPTSLKTPKSMKTPKSLKTPKSARTPKPSKNPKSTRIRKSSVTSAPFKSQTHAPNSPETTKSPSKLRNPTIIKKIRWKPKNQSKFSVRNTPLSFVYDRRLVSRLYKQLGNYGCWCHFGSTANAANFDSINQNSMFDLGSGRPINEVDSICREYVLAMRCLHKDYPVKDAIDLSERQPKISVKPDLEGIRMDCHGFYNGFEGSSDNNPLNRVLVDKCVIERTFTTKVLELMMGGYVFDSSFKHSTKNSFDPVDSCQNFDYEGIDDLDQEHSFEKTINGHNFEKFKPRPDYVKSEFKCCGDYPFRQKC